MTNPNDTSVALMGVKGGPAIRPGSNMPTSILVRMGGKAILVDAGLGAARGLCDHGVALPALDAVFVTHLHSDHYLELGPLIHTAWTAGLTRPIPIYGPAGLEDYWKGFLASMQADIALRIADEGRVDLAALAKFTPLASNNPIDIDGVRVDKMLNDHPPIRESYALRFNTDAHRVVLSGDTAFMKEMIEFSGNADLLVHEVMLSEGVETLMAHMTNGDDRLRQHILRSHTDARDVGRIAAAAEVKHLALNHFVPDGLPGFDGSNWVAAVRETWDGPLTLGRDGLVIAV